MKPPKPWRVLKDPFSREQAVHLLYVQPEMHGVFSVLRMCRYGADEGLGDPGWTDGSASPSPRPKSVRAQEKNKCID